MLKNIKNILTKIFNFYNSDKICIKHWRVFEMFQNLRQIRSSGKGLHRQDLEKKDLVS